MKFRIICVVCTFFCFNQQILAQLTGAGIQPKMNFSKHLYVEQNIPLKFARTINSGISSPGVDLFADFSLGEKWKFRTKAGIETKGTVIQHHLLSQENRTNKFHYVSADLNLIRYWGQGKKIQPYNYVGVTSGYVVKKDVYELSTLTEMWFGNGARLDYRDNSKFNLGFTAGAGLSFNDVLWLELEFNRDVLPIFNQPDLKVYNSVYSINAGINLLKLFQKKD